MSDMKDEKTPLENENEEECEVYTLTDENGNESEFTLIGSVNKKGNDYYALIPADPDEESEYLEYVILKKTVENGEEMLVTIDDDDEYEDIAAYFDEVFADEIDLDAGTDGQ